MKFLLHLFMVMALAYSSYASAAPLHDCCADSDCTMVQCSQMGCLPAPAPIATASALMVRFIRAGQDYAPEALRRLTPMFEELWTPPD